MNSLKKNIRMTNLSLGFFSKMIEPIVKEKTLNTARVHGNFTDEKKSLHILRGMKKKREGQFEFR